MRDVPFGNCSNDWIRDWILRDGTTRQIEWLRLGERERERERKRKEESETDDSNRFSSVRKGRSCGCRD